MPVLSLEEIRSIASEMLALPALERAVRFDLDSARSEYMPVALLTLEAVLEGSGLDRIAVVRAGLAEGLVYDFLAGEAGAAPLPALPEDARIRTILDLAAACGYPAEHSHQVAGLADRIFLQMAWLHGLGEEEARLLRYGAILHDIGYHIAYRGHHRHGYHLVLHCDLRGIPPSERGVVAALVRYHRRGVPRPSQPVLRALPPKDRRRVMALTAISRIADALDRAHFSLVEDVEIRRVGARVVFHLRVRGLARTMPPDIEALQRHARYFEKLFGVRTAFRARRPPRRAAGKTPGEQRAGGGDA